MGKPHKKLELQSWTTRRPGRRSARSGDGARSAPPASRFRRASPCCRVRPSLSRPRREQMAACGGGARDAARLRLAAAPDGGGAAAAGGAASRRRAAPPVLTPSFLTARPSSEASHPTVLVGSPEIFWHTPEVGHRAEARQAEDRYRLEEGRTKEEGGVNGGRPSSYRSLASEGRHAGCGDKAPPGCAQNV
jgi:hypothetical protein